MRPMRLPARFAVLLVAWILAVGAMAKEGPKGVHITEMKHRLQVTINGQLFTEYHFKDVPRPFCYPVLGPGGAAMTRNFPMKEVEGEEQDHPHHRSLWFAHGTVNGIDFWSEQKQFGRQVHEKFLTIRSQETAVIKSLNKWVAPDGRIVCRDERTLRFYNSENPRIIDFEITIKATEGAVTFGDTKEGTMAIRLAETMRLNPNKANKGQPIGHIVQSTGITDTAAWGKRADWCDYSGLVNGREMGVAIFDHPANPRHPTWWHVRDYGLFAANPFGVHDFEGKPAGQGNFTIQAGKSATFRYRIILHEGDAKSAGIANLYQAFAKSRPK